jgi:hypothetical protein
MGYGGGIFLLTVGAVLAFAVRVRLWWLDVHVAGLVLMLAGAAVLAVTTWYWHVARRPAPPTVSQPVPPAVSRPPPAATRPQPPPEPPPPPPAPPAD